MWDSDIGEAAITLDGFDEWRLMTGVGLDTSKESAPPTSTGPKRKRRRAPKVIERRVKEWIEGSEKPTLQSFVVISVKELNTLWRKGIHSSLPDDECRERGKELMKNVYTATELLRKCYTDLAVERSCLQIATSLLDLAADPNCSNPFLCLQQAAAFASQGSKEGNSDILFRHSIPQAKDCTAFEALIILGRADCLHSVHFPNEAAYLCSYVARVCSLHRDRERPEFEWNSQWKVVAIYGFNVSVMIRSTVTTVMAKERQKEFLAMWQRDVIEELERARSDALAWKRAISAGTNRRPLHDAGNDGVVKSVVIDGMVGVEDEEDGLEEEDDDMEEEEEEEQNFDRDGEEEEDDDEDENIEEGTDGVKTNNNDEDDVDDGNEDEREEEEDDDDDDDDEGSKGQMEENSHASDDSEDGSTGSHDDDSDTESDKDGRLTSSVSPDAGHPILPFTPTTHEVYMKPQDESESDEDDILGSVEIVGV